jgi:hypothetical protein
MISQTARLCSPELLIELMRPSSNVQAAHILTVSQQLQNYMT